VPRRGNPDYKSGSTRSRRDLLLRPGLAQAILLEADGQSHAPWLIPDRADANEREETQSFSEKPLKPEQGQAARLMNRASA